MSFVCDHCKRIVTDDCRKLRDGQPHTVQRDVKPVRVVTRRHVSHRVAVGQIAREENWCHACVRDSERCDGCDPVTTELALSYRWSTPDGVTTTPPGPRYMMVKATRTGLGVEVECEEVTDEPE